MKLTRTLLLTAALGVAAPGAQANLIINGGFESPDIATGTFAILGTIPGWSTTFGAGIEIQDHVAGSPFEGDQHVELDSVGNSGMVQTVVPTVAGTGYRFSFAYSPRPGVSLASNPIDVLVNGVLIDTVSASGIGLTDTSWTIHSYLVSAVGTSTAIEFRATGTSDSLGGYLDDVRFDVNVPEPAGVALVLTGLLALALTRRRPAGRRA